MAIVRIEIKLEEKETKYFEKNGGHLLVKKLEKRNRKLKGERLEVKIYSTQQLDSISTFVDESDKIKCYSTVKFYRGTLPLEQDTSTKDEVVVQTIEGGVPEDKIKDFVDQLIFLSEPHQNLVRVLGCCLATFEPVIVYELRDNDIIPLSDCTSSSDHAANFSCEKRIEAAKGVARGLKHLYEFKPKFVLEEICTANIMINTTSYEPKIFYAAWSKPIAPATDQKSDVYRFGEVLVELLTGGRKEGTDLSNSIETAQDKGLFEILDDEMKSKDPIVKKIATVADNCLNVTPKERPTMKEVLHELLRPAKRTRESLHQFRFKPFR